MGANVMTVDDFRLLLEDVLDQPDLTLGPETTAKDIEGWDSLNHVRVLLRIEQNYGIDLPVGDIETAKNVGELLAVINGALASAR
jgi:acyl carrier protein